MTVNFLEKDTNDRLIAAIIASVDNKVNPKEISRMYGDSVSFNTLEWYIRKIRHKAIEMKAEADGCPLLAASAAKKAKGRKKKGNKNPTTNGVKTGRVTKNRAPAAKIKSEPMVEDDVLHEYSSGNDDGTGRGGGMVDPDEFL